MPISVVIPAFNEAGNIGALVRETAEQIAPEILGEIIVVDDCSDDGTGDEVKALFGRIEGLRYLRHAIRAGQSASLRTGVKAAAFSVIATMDGDGQNDPRDIPRLLALLAEPGRLGPALVGGVRADRKGAGSRRVASRLANAIRDAVLADDCPDTGCGIKVYWRSAFLDLPFFTSIHRFLPALFLTYGHQVAYASVNDRPRRAGVSKYGNFSRAVIGLYDLVGVTWLRRRTKTPDLSEDIASASGPRRNSAELRDADPLPLSSSHLSV